GPACSLRCSRALAVPSLPRARADGALDCLPPLLKATLRWPSLTRRAETLRPLRWLRRRREGMDLPRPAGSRAVPSMTCSDELGSNPHFSNALAVSGIGASFPCAVTVREGIGASLLSFPTNPKWG